MHVVFVCRISIHFAFFYCRTPHVRTLFTGDANTASWNGSFFTMFLLVFMETLALWTTRFVLPIVAFVALAAVGTDNGI